MYRFRASCVRQGLVSAFALAALSTTTACNERVPSELRPGFDEMIGLPFNICTEEGNGPATLLIRNIGDDDVTIESVAFEADPDQPDALSSFDEPVVDTETLLADTEAFVRFTYRVPGGLAQRAVLVIKSDAAENPSLEVPVETQELVVENKDEICAEE